MKIKVNGEEKKIELDQENALLSKALNLMGYKPNTIVVELNNLIINSIKWEKVKLKDGLMGICISLFPQYLTRAMFDGDCQVVVPDNLFFSNTIFLDGLNITI